MEVRSKRAREDQQPWLCCVESPSLVDSLCLFVDFCVVARQLFMGCLEPRPYAILQSIVQEERDMTPT